MDSNEDEREKQGCKEVFCGKRMKEWAFWFIVAFLAALTIRDLYNLIKEYTENPKKSDMNGNGRGRFNGIKIGKNDFCGFS